MNRHIILLTALVACLPPHAGGSPLRTGFTFQGNLATGGEPAVGLYQFRFALYDSPTTGQQFGDVATNGNVTVSAGLRRNDTRIEALPCQSEAEPVPHEFAQPCVKRERVCDRALKHSYK